MSRDARRKEKQRLKRKQKQAQARKAASVTPLERVAKGAGQLECYVNDDWPESGMASVQVLGIAPDGRCAHAALLVDVWCVGLKDAYGHRTTLRGEFEDQLDQMSVVLDMVRISASEARRLVAGGIRFARQNGFHLPPHYERWTAIFGKLGEVAGADLRDFGVDGGLRYVGDEQFLRKRLAGCSVEQFLARPDVQWVMADGTPRDELEDSDDNEFAEEEFDEEDDAGALAPGAGLDLSDEPILRGLTNILGSVGDRAEDAVRQWCFRTGQVPHPRLREALDVLLVSAMPTALYQQAAEEAPDEEDAGEELAPPDPDSLLKSGLSSLPAH